MPILCIPFYIFTTILVHRIFDDTTDTTKMINNTKTIFKRIKSKFIFLLKSHQNKEDNHKWNFLIPFVIEFLIEFSIQFWIWFNFCNGKFHILLFLFKTNLIQFSKCQCNKIRKYLYIYGGILHHLKQFTSLLTVKQTKLSIEV